MQNGKIAVATYAVSHFFVDFSCAVALFGLAYASPQWYLCLLLYNFCAFALQMPIGLLADRWNRNALCAAAGCALIAFSFGLSPVPLALAAAAGVGNALFHIGGGIDVLNVSGEKSGPLGVFVSPGAVGVYLGTLLGKQGAVPPALAVGLLLAAAAAILLAQYLPGKTLQSGNAPLSFPAKLPLPELLAMVCLFLVVCLRSYVGMTLTFPWKGEGHWGVALLCAVVLGKALGGFAADRFGAQRAAAVSLGFAAALFLFPAFAPAGVAAALLFNMTMPVTLWALSRRLPGSKGFSFGLLTFALFLGFAPVYLGVDALLASGLGFALAALFSLVLLLAGLRKLP